MNRSIDIRSALQEATYPASPEAFDAWRLELLKIIDSSESSAAADEGHTRLSPREREVMLLLMSGTRLKEIAVELKISVKTVTTHRARLLRKLGLQDNLGLYRYGIRNGLIAL